MTYIGAIPVAGTHAYINHQRARLTPGTRVICSSPGHLNGQTGVIITMPEKLLNGHDCAVMLDRDRDWPLCFYWHELAVKS